MSELKIRKGFRLVIIGSGPTAFGVLYRIYSLINEDKLDPSYIQVYQLLFLADEIPDKYRLAAVFDAALVHYVGARSNGNLCSQVRIFTFFSKYQLKVVLGKTCRRAPKACFVSFRNRSIH